MIPLLADDAARAWLKQQQRRRDDGSVETAVKSILQEVREGGDKALAEIAQRLGDPQPRTIISASLEINEQIATLPPAARETIEFASRRISGFAKAIMASLKPVDVEYEEYRAGMRYAPVERVACYVPGGRYALPSTALMTAISARVAGVKEIALFTPQLRPEIFLAGSLAGVNEFHQIGGAQAIAAAAFGTETIKRADMIVGPGNAYVAEAKRQVQGLVGIDMPAGPSEIAVVADSGGCSQWVALDLLSQAEHDPDARSYLLTNSAGLAGSVAAQLPEMAAAVGAPDFVRQSLGQSAILVLESIEECIAAADEIAPEHLVLHVRDPEHWQDKPRNYGALFLGYHATVPHGDYCAGPNHTLPTNRAARFTGGLSPLTFLRTQTWLSVPKPAKQLGEHTAAFADLEGLKSHAAAARARCLPADSSV